MYQLRYQTPFGFDDMLMTSDGEYLTGLWFVESKDLLKHVVSFEEKDLPVFQETKKWLDIYFSRKIPDFIPRYRLEYLTKFRQEVTDIMNTISYGCTVSYGEIAKIIADRRGLKRMSSQAVGKAVGANPICIIIPCHRVVGKDGNLTGYGGGIKNKFALLALEQEDMSNFFVSKKEMDLD